MRLSTLFETSIGAAEQLKEALSDVNKWYCSQELGYEVTDPEILLRYYITHGGAKGYRERHPCAAEEAKAPVEPWTLPRSSDATEGQAVAKKSA